VAIGERVTLFGAVTVLLDAPQGATLRVYTDMPGDALALRHTATIAPTSSRRPVRVKFPGATKGRIWYPEVLPPANGTVRLYGMEVWARVLPGPWAWYAVPVIQTGEWQPLKLDIPPTGDWQPLKLAIPPTPEEWTALPMGIEPTPDNWTAMKFPLKPTPETGEWVSLPMDE
jgi:hypothetical protein